MRFSLLFIIAFSILLSSCSIFQNGQSRYTHVKKVKIDTPLEYARHDMEKTPSIQSKAIRPSSNNRNEQIASLQLKNPFESVSIQKTVVQKPNTTKPLEWKLPQLKKQAIAKQMESSSRADTTHVLLTVLLVILIFALLSAIIPGIFEILLSILLILLLVLLILYLAGSL